MVAQLFYMALLLLSHFGKYQPFTLLFDAPSYILLQFSTSTACNSWYSSLITLLALLLSLVDLTTKVLYCLPCNYIIILFWLLVNPFLLLFLNFVTVFVLFVIVKRYLVTIFILLHFYIKVNCFWLLF